MNWVEKESIEDNILSEAPTLRLPRLDLVAGVIVAVASALFAGFAGVEPPSLATPQNANASVEPVEVAVAPQAEPATTLDGFWKEKQQAIVMHARTLDLEEVFKKVATFQEESLQKHHPDILAACERMESELKIDATLYKQLLDRMNSYDVESQPDLPQFQRPVKRVSYFR